MDEEELEEFYDECDKASELLSDFVLSMADQELSFHAVYSALITELAGMVYTMCESTDTTMDEELKRIISYTLKVAEVTNSRQSIH